jgi:NAD(P)H-hydrate epimerase
MVLTPHFAEAARLMDMPVAEIQKDRLAAARQCALAYRSVTLLKGPGTVSTDGHRCHINTSGNDLLAAAGTGDVLSGLIGALLARGHDPLEAAASGAFIHGLAADRIALARPRATLKATDLIEELGPALDSLH